MNDTRFPNVKVHPTAVLEEGVQIGEHSSVWDNVHIRKNTRIGHHTIIGEKTYIAYDVEIGNYVKINAMVYICTGVRIEEMCMIAAGVVFTNALYPRAMNRELTALEVSEPTEDTLLTVVRRGVTIGANATVGPGISLGEFAFIAMGAVVTNDVVPHALVTGNPARVAGYVCICGPRLVSLKSPPDAGTRVHCSRCGRVYRWTGEGLQLDDAM